MGEMPVVRWLRRGLGMLMLGGLVFPMVSTAKAPVLKPQSTLSSLASASGTRARCDVLLRWLESGGAPGARGGAGTLDVFRDEQMLAVFARTYDQDAGNWHLETYQSTIAPCLGLRPPPRGLLGRLFSPEPPDPEQVRQLSRHAYTLRQAFEGQRGPADATQIARFLADVRDQIQRANAVMVQADEASVDLTSLTQLRARAAEVRGYTRLSAADRQLVLQFVAQRESELVPAVAQQWIAQARTTPPSTEAALQLGRDYKQLRRTLGALPSPLSDDLDREVQQLVEAGIAPGLMAEQDRLLTTPATREGAQRLTDWERDVLGRYADTKAPSIDQAMRALDEARTRVLTAMLPAWKAQVAALGTGAEVAAHRDELKVLFGAGGGRLSALQQEFRAPLEARNEQIVARAAEEEKARLVQAQRASALPAGRGNQGALSASDLVVTAQRSAVVRSIFLGSFEDIAAAPGSTEISALASGYMQQFYAQCAKHIADPVELTRQECASETVTRNGYGVEVSRVCSSYRTVGTGVYAERSLNKAISARGVDQVGASMRTVMGMLSGGKGSNPLAAAANLVNVVQAYSEAGKDAVASNACDGAPLERFRVNLENFLVGKPGVQPDGSRAMGVAMLPAAPGETYRDSNYERLLEDLVSDASRSWAFNRYVAKSIQGARVTERDSAGRPAKVAAGYRFQGMRGMETGGVSLDFVEGRPRCLYFSDVPSACRALNTRVVADYVNGKYR